MIKKPDRKIILENGSQYLGIGFADQSDKVVEIVFNTSMVGYQEILSDPSYTDQGVVFTYPLIRNRNPYRKRFDSQRIQSRAV